MLDKLITEKEAASLLSVSPETLKKARLNKTSPDYVRVGRCIRYRMSALASYLDSNTITHKRSV
jgi:hypothetical protein